MKHLLAAHLPPRAAAWTLAVLRALLATPSLAAWDPAGDESARIAAAVRQAILDNPDTVRDALIKMWERDQAPWQAPSAQAVNQAGEPWLGEDRTGSLVQRLHSTSAPSSPSARLRTERNPRHARHLEPQ